MIIAVDFDGVLSSAGKWPEVGEPNEALMDWLSDLRTGGHKVILWTCRVGEANLLFAYEVGLDLFTVYVIALSEHYGAIVFYLPEDLTREIARHLPPDETFRRYIANLIERQAGLRNINTVLKGFGMGCEAAAEALLELSAAVGKVMDKPIDYREMPNNWLKMHHKPMRRKGKGRKNK